MSVATSVGTVSSETSLIITNRLYKPNASAVPVIYCHSATQTGLQLLPKENDGSTNYYIGQVAQRLAEAGHPVIGTDLGGANQWGADPVPQRITDAIAAVAAKTGCSATRILLLAMSMGTVAALNFARLNPSLVAAVAALLPAVNLAQIHASGPAPIPANIDTAYTGMSGGYAGQVATHDPAQNEAGYTVPTKLWNSGDDPTALPTEVAAFAAATSSSVVTFGNAGHNLTSALDPYDVVRWLHAHA